MGLLPAGTMLGRHELIRLLSVGGMAEIYLARTEGIAGFEKRVVVKRMLPHFAIQPGYVRMFLDEARLAARLDHPNVVSVHDIGEDTGNYHYAMEYVRGGDLRDLCKAVARSGDPMPLGVAITIALGVCAGLDYAHNLCGEGGRPLDVVHRDVSLSNVLVSFDGAVKVTDFGVAKMQQAEHRTRTGTLKGKVAYMSPEQCKGLPVDRRSDVFSIGILMYELITCRRLFGGHDNELMTLQRIVQADAPSPSQLRPNCPVALDEIVARALCRDREHRYQTARELQRDLEALVRTERLASSSSELAEFVSRLLGGAPRRADTAATSSMAASPGSPSPNPWDAESDIDDGSGAEVSVEVLLGNESKPVPAVSAGGAPSRRGHQLMTSQRWERVTRFAALSLVAAALLTASLWRRSDEMPAEVPPMETDKKAVGSFEPRPKPIAVAVVEPVAEPAPGPKPEPEPEPEPEPVPMAVAAPLVDAGPATESRRAVARSARHEDEPRKRVRRGRDAGAIDDSPAMSVADSDRVMEPDPAPRVPIDAAPEPDAGLPRAAPRRSLPPPLAPPADSPRPAPVAIGSLDATASVSRIDVKGPLQDSEIRRALERVMPAVRACYRDAAARAQRTPKLELRVSFQIDDTRAARSVHASSSALAGLSGCVADAVGRARTRVAPDVGNASVHLAVTFTPTD